CNSPKPVICTSLRFGATSTMCGQRWPCTAPCSWERARPRQIPRITVIASPMVSRRAFKISSRGCIKSFHSRSASLSKRFTLKDNHCGTDRDAIQGEQRPAGRRLAVDLGAEAAAEVGEHPGAVFPGDLQMVFAGVRLIEAQCTVPRPADGDRL